MPETPATVIEREADVVVVHVQVKDFDEEHLGQVREDIAKAVAEWPGLPFILDLKPVKFVPSLTLGALVRLANEFRGRKQRLILVALQPTVRQVIAITRLDRIFDMMDDVAGAKKSLGIVEP